MPPAPKSKRSPWWLRIVPECDDDVQAKLDRIERKVDRIMATQKELLAALGEANDATNEIASDIAELMARSEVPDEVRDAAAALVTRLRGVASTFPAVETPAP